MKKKITITEHNKKVEREITYIPFRYILAILITILETAAIIAIVVLLSLYVPYFYIVVLITQVGTAISIINRSDNPDYKLPWLFLVLLIPIIGFMLYFMFYSRRLKRKQIKRINSVMQNKVEKNSDEIIEKIAEEDLLISTQVAMIENLSKSHIYTGTEIKYFPLGEEMFDDMLKELKNAEKFIFLEYFIIEQGLFWNSILDILKEKVQNGVEVRLIYDDIGCMLTLPGNYYKRLRKLGIKAVPFAFLRGQADNEFNNRSHRKITVIDGKIAYTGGINLADEYINHVEKHGHWKDGGIKLQGEAVNEFTRLFLLDYALNDKKTNDDFSLYYGNETFSQDGYCLPFGDGPKPLYKRQVSKPIILNLLNTAKRYVYITSPYLIVDSELMQAIENAALRGIDVRIITPHVPDKKLIFLMTQSCYGELIKTGVKIYEYEKGFIHAKTYISDDKVAMVGTINMDYRSLVHHFENGVWLYSHPVIEDIKQDFLATQEKSIKIEQNMLKENPWRKFVRRMIKVFSPLF